MTVVPPRLSCNRRLLAGPTALLGLAVIAFAIVFMTGGSAHGQGSLVSTEPQDIAAGQVLYQTHCQSCHGYQGRGGVVAGAPQLITSGAAAADFYLSTGRMPLNAPNNQALSHRPAFTPVQIRQLVAYVNALPQINGVDTSGPTIPDVEPLCQDQTTPTTGNTGCVTLSEGESLYAVNCAQCHQAAGAGGMLSKGNVVPSMQGLSQTQIAEAPIVGPKPMPIFSQFSNHQISALAQYAKYLQHPTSPGGNGIAHFGPVPEGFFAVLLGFVILWFAARMIGTRG